MTQRDKWKKRPVVLRWFAFKDLLIYLTQQHSYTVTPTVFLTFVVPMPSSWSNKKKREMSGKPHQQRPDVDNFTKAFLDALCEDDSYVWYTNTQKIWGEEGAIIIHN